MKGWQIDFSLDGTADSQGYYPARWQEVELADVDVVDPTALLLDVVHMLRGHRGVESLPEFLTTREAAQYLGMSRKALHAAVERGQIPCSRLGRRLRFSREGLKRLLKQRTRTA